MIDRYVCTFTFLLVDLVMLTNMEAAGRVSPPKEGLPLPFNFTNASSFLYHSERHILSYFLCDYLLANVAPSPRFHLIVISSNFELYCDFVRHYGEEIERRIFLYWPFLEVSATLMIVKPILLTLCESMPFQ